MSLGLDEEVASADGWVVYIQLATPALYLLTILRVFFLNYSFWQIVKIYQNLDFIRILLPS